MEPSLFASSPDKSELDLKSSFRKPTNDATSRKYQRHSPVGRSDSSSSGVNRSLVGFGGVGFLSTDQKKKLLWGNKKNNPTEESSSRWDLHLFQDLERQEKFNRLMGVKGTVAPPENGPDDKDGSLQAKKTGGARCTSGEAICCWSSGSWLVMT
ncbi:uncharacterized protein LOC135593180 isoform X2 [Musa acuminata AAA Group]|uniref:uncharacterized protein LOC135593180 isoform X2 n=1 Tax=Musa acuminata AAA Group TaxID=214697 RepID=UPI0031DECA94